MESYLFTIDNRNDFLSEISRAYVANAFKKTGIPKSINIGELIIDKFSDGEYSPNFKHSIRGCRIYLVGSTNTPDNILRMLLTIDAAKRASVREIVVVSPILGYSRQDKKDGKRGAIGAKLMADLLIAAGANRIMSVDLHAEQIEGYYNIPFDHIAGQRLFEKWILDNLNNNNNFTELVLCSPDAGGTKRVDKYWRRLSENYNIISYNNVQSIGSTTNNYGINLNINANFNDIIKLSHLPLSLSFLYCSSISNFLFNKILTTFYFYV